MAWLYTAVLAEGRALAPVRLNRGKAQALRQAKDKHTSLPIIQRVNTAARFITQIVIYQYLLLDYLITYCEEMMIGKISQATVLHAGLSEVYCNTQNQHNHLILFGLYRFVS